MQSLSTHSTLPLTDSHVGESREVEVRVLVEDDQAFRFNLEQESLEDILILHLENGKDCFVHVTGQWVPTCFSQPLERLVRLSSAIRCPSLEGAVTVWPSEQRLSIPRELWRMCDYLFQHATSKVNGDELEKWHLCASSSSSPCYPRRLPSTNILEYSIHDTW